MKLDNTQEAALKRIAYAASLYTHQIGNEKLVACELRKHLAELPDSMQEDILAGLVVDATATCEMLAQEHKGKAA